MITFEDCLGCCDLTEDEIDAIVAHEHLPEMVALELVAYLMQTPAGCRRVQTFLSEQEVACRRAGDHRTADRIAYAARDFHAAHPAA